MDEIVNPEEFEPQIENQLTTPRLKIRVPVAHIKAEDLQDFQQRDREVLLSMSVIEQYQMAMIDWILIHNKAIRRLEAEAIRQRPIMSERAWQWDFLKWLGVTVGAGAIAFLLRQLFSVS